MGKLTARLRLRVEEEMLFDKVICLEAELQDNHHPVGIYTARVAMPEVRHERSADIATHTMMDIFQSLLNGVLAFAQQYGIDGEAAIKQMEPTWPLKILSS